MQFVAAVFLPLLGSIVAGFFGRFIGDRGAQLVTCTLLGISAACSALIFKDVAIDGNAVTITLLHWIQSGSLDVSWALKFDTLTAVMLIVVTWVSFMVHVYSVGYMSHDPAIPRFMSYLSLFTFAMLMLVTADNLIQLFFGWEGVGLASYLLIGFWFEKPSASAAAIKAFVVNRVGDFGFALGIFGVFFLFDSVSFDAIFAAAPDKAAATVTFFGLEANAITICCLLLFVGAMGKSAQLGLHTWLPDAMEGPTPVSALIHAATMVTAGVFMVARMSPLFEYSDTALTVVTLVGAATAFFAATVGCVQNDIKRVIAYSTCSQLGYMFFAIGVSAYQAAVFHLMTHAFFKALLFLGAGSVIHAMSDEQDIRRMGGIWKHVKVTWVLMWIGSLALAGIPFFAGYYSKDMILEAAFASHSLVGQLAYWMGIGAAFLTAFYSWRLLILTFHGKPRADEHVMAHVHESPAVMILPLFVLAAGAVFGGWLGYDMFVGHAQEHFWRDAIKDLHQTIEHAHHVEEWVALAPTVVGVAGIFLAYVLYMFVPSIPGALANTFNGLYRFLLNKWYFDELYDFLFVRPAFRIGRGLWQGGDGALIDGVGPDGVAAATGVIARKVGKFQSGYLYHYAFAMLIGVAVFVTWYMFNAR
ncbi:NADH-quinone oxidoreductase subunit L [Magnetospirillum aberrantis]|uniref:NADH-quinone oxidoreductase subunit L n=1 Tax=Magnetospirillum aberrantis SpK TaxID=908842 RepID=A0A7C9UWF4_9PROT|nr:NADH-quinone oxidoreductase subunit L [Magnetospirillum aberrantis]NFV80112.1 NADH-quinone oxidoreductase subunit L [Magnetospirillum aberrantis SpK]